MHIISFAILYSLYSFSSVEIIIIIIMKFEKVGRVPPPPQHLSSCRWFTVKEDEGRTLWLDTQSHASSSASSADDDYTWQWPTSFWSQFKVSITFSKFLILAGEQHTVCSDFPRRQEIRKLTNRSFPKKIQSDPPFKISLCFSSEIRETNWKERRWISSRMCTTKRRRRRSIYR